VGAECHQLWRFVGRHFQLYDTSPMILNWPWAWPCWNCTGSYNFSVSVKKMGKGWTGGASNRGRSKQRGCSPGAAASHRSRTRVPTGFFPVVFHFSCGSRHRSQVFFGCFFLLGEIRRLPNPKPEIGHSIWSKKSYYFVVSSHKTWQLNWRSPKLVPKSSKELCHSKNICSDIYHSMRFHG